MGGARPHDLFRYLTADDTDGYFAVMDCVTASGSLGRLHTDLSAADIAETLAERALEIPIETITARCRSLVRWGNLTAVVGGGPRTARYRATVAGVRVHRDVTGVLSSRDEAHAITHESLGTIADGLARIQRTLDRSGFAIDTDLLAEQVTTVFAHHRLFTEAVSDFCADLPFLLERLSPASVSDEDSEVGTALLDHLDVLVAEVTRRAPLVASRLRALSPRWDLLCSALSGPAIPPSVLAPAPGRSRDEWARLLEWYDDAGPRHIRETTGTAVHRLLERTRRPAHAVTETSLRTQFLDLAREFSESSDEQAHRMFTARFGAYPSRHLLLGPEEPDPRIGPAVSWWNDDPVPVPTSLRTRGDRSLRGRVARVPDPGADHTRATHLAEEEELRRREAAAELCAPAELHGAVLSARARDLLLGSLSDLLSRHPAGVGPSCLVNRDRGFSLYARHGADTVVHCPDGDLTVRGLTLSARPIVRERPEAHRTDAS